MSEVDLNFILRHYMLYREWHAGGALPEHVASEFEFVREAIRALPERERLVIFAIDIAGQPQGQIAERLGVDRSTVRRLQMAARTKLHLAIGREED